MCERGKHAGGERARARGKHARGEHTKEGRSTQKRWSVPGRGRAQRRGKQARERERHVREGGSACMKGRSV